MASKEPLIRIARKSAPSAKSRILVHVFAIVMALIVDAVLILAVTGKNPFAIYLAMFDGNFGSSKRIMWMLRDLSTLLLLGVALAPAFKMRFWNIGAEGQVLVGGLATALVMVYLGNVLPTPVLFLVMFLASVIAGAVWGFIPAYFKAKWQTNETLFTLMMNYVAIQIVACFVNILRGKASALGKLNMASKAGWFPEIAGQRYIINIIVVVVITVLMFFYLRNTKHGYEIAVVGESKNTARYTGINVKLVTIRTMILSGAICGLCGFLLVGGRDQTISTGTAGGNGFTAIIVAWLAKFNTFYMILISFLLVFMEKGAHQVASKYDLNDYFSDILSGVILFFILGCEFFINYKLILRHKEGGEQ